MPSPDTLDILRSAMAMPILIVVGTTQAVLTVADLDLIATILVVVFAAGIGWFLWRHR